MSYSLSDVVTDLVSVMLCLITVHLIEFFILDHFAFFFLFRRAHIQEADVAVGDLTISLDREKVVDFTMPFMNLGISILFKKPTKNSSNLFSFLQPLSEEVWMYMVTAYLGVSIILFLLARYRSADFFSDSILWFPFPSPLCSKLACFTFAQFEHTWKYGLWRILIDT